MGFLLAVSIMLVVNSRPAKWEPINFVDMCYDFGQRHMITRDDVIYHVHSNELAILNTTDPSNITVVKQYINDVKIMGIALFQDYALLTNLSSGLEVLDISNLESPKQIAEYPQGREISYTEILVEGNLAFVSVVTPRSLLILDIAAPNKIRAISRLSIDGEPFALKDGYLYTGGRHVRNRNLYDSLNIFDISDINNPELVFFADTFGEVRYAAIQDNYLYLSTTDTLTVLDISDPTNPIEVGNLNLLISELLPSGDYLYYFFVTGGVGVVDISDPTKPKKVALNDEVAPTELSVSDGYVYFADNLNRRLYVFDEWATKGNKFPSNP